MMQKVFDSKQQLEASGNPLVTAVVTTYNRPQLVQRAIKSVLAQTYEPLEIIVVEDGSDSDVEAWLQDKGLKAVRYIRHEGNKGLAAARNTGLRHAPGKYVAFLDDDDEWLPEKLAKQVELAETKTGDWAVIYCGVQIIGADGQILGKNRPKLRGDIRAEIGRKGLFTVPSSCLFLRKALQHVGGYDEALASHVDHGIWMKLAQMEYKADNVDECLVRACQHQGIRMTKDVEARIQATEMYIETWLPQWEEWFGGARAHEYFSQFYARELMAQGANCIDRGEVLAGVRCYWYITRRDPGRIRSYTDSAISFAKALLRQTRFYRPLRQLRRKMVGRPQQDAAVVTRH